MKVYILVGDRLSNPPREKATVADGGGGGEGLEGKDITV